MSGSVGLLPNDLLLGGIPLVQFGIEDIFNLCALDLLRGREEIVFNRPWLVGDCEKLQLLKVLHLGVDLLQQRLEFGVDVALQLRVWELLVDIFGEHDNAIGLGVPGT